MTVLEGLALAFGIVFLGGWLIATLILVGAAMDRAFLDDDRRANRYLALAVVSHLAMVAFVVYLTGGTPL